jgi:hypothetical protein
VAARSKAWVCCCSPAEIVGSNPTEGMDVLSGRSLCDELVTRPKESYRLWRVVVCDLVTSWKRRPWPSGWAVAPKTNKQWLIMLQMCSYNAKIRMLCKIHDQMFWTWKRVTCVGEYCDTLQTHTNIYVSGICHVVQVCLCRQWLFMFEWMKEYDTSESI